MSAAVRTRANLQLLLGFDAQYGNGSGCKQVRREVLLDRGMPPSVLDEETAEHDLELTRRLVDFAVSFGDALGIRPSKIQKTN